MDQTYPLKQQTNNIDEVEQLIQECNDININPNESDISFDLGQFNDYLQNQKVTQVNQSQSNQTVKMSTHSKPEQNLDNSEEKDKIINFNQFDSIIQKSQFNFNESIFTHQISKQIGNFESSRIESYNNDFKNGLLNQNQFNENNISDNYVEYIEKFLKNINIQDIQENEKSIEQALQLANQNLNLDYNQQSIMLNSLLYEINNMNQLQESNENDIIIMDNSQVKHQEDLQQSQQIHDRRKTEQNVQSNSQTQNEKVESSKQESNQSKQEQKQEQNQEQKQEQKQEQNQEQKQEQKQSRLQNQQFNPTIPIIPIKESKKIKQILKQKSGKSGLCLIFQMIQFLCIW